MYPFELPGRSVALRWDMLAQRPTDLLAELTTARRALRHGHYAEAEACTARLLRRMREEDVSAIGQQVVSQPQSELRASALVIRGLAAGQLGQDDEMRRYVQEGGVAVFDGLVATGRRPEPLSLTDYGIGLLLVGRTDAAGDYVISALNADVEMAPHLIVRLAQELLQGGRSERACWVLRAAHKLYPRHVDIAVLLAQALEAAGERGLSADAYATAGVLLAEEGRLDPALEHFSHARTLAPDVPEVALAQAQLLLATNRLDEARDTIDEIVAGHPDLAGGYALRAQRLAMMGDLGRALQVVEEVLTRFDRDPWLLDIWIRLLRAMGRPAAARQALDEALSVEPADTGWLRLKAALLEAEGATEEAIATLRRLAAAAPESVEHHHDLVELLARDGQQDAALDALRTALQIAPHDPRLLRVQAKLLAGQGRHLEAVAAARQAIDQGGRTPQVYDWLAASLLAIGDAEGALQAATEALDEAPDLLSARRSRGLARARTGRHEAAVEDLEEVLRQDPDDKEVRQVLAEARKALADELQRRASDLVDAGEHDEARQLLERAVDLDPRHVDAHGLQGEIFRRLGDNQRALEHLDAALKIQPGSARFVGTRGRVLRAMRDPAAVDELRRAVELDGGLAWLHAELGDALRIERRFREARRELEDAVDLDPGSAWVWASKGAAELSAGSYEKARTSLDTAIALDDEYAWAYAVKGWLVSMLDELEPALKAVERALELDPNLSWAWTIKGWLFELLDRDARQCEQMYRRALEGNPDELDALIGAAESLLRQDRRPEAEELFRRGLAVGRARAESNASVRAGVGWCLLRLGQCEEAAEALDDAVARDESLIEAEFDLGLALLCCGRPDVAVEEYREAATRTRALRHVGRRANLVRVAQRDLRLAVAGKLVPDGPELAEIDEILASIPTGGPPKAPDRS